MVPSVLVFFFSPGETSCKHESVNTMHLTERSLVQTRRLGQETVDQAHTWWLGVGASLWRCPQSRDLKMLREEPSWIATESIPGGVWTHLAC